MKKYLVYGFLITMTAFITSCEKEEPEIPEVEEVITTLIYTLTSENGDVVTMTFRDLDGDGGNAPTVTGGTLTQNTIYTGSIELSNESETPAEDITEEIAEEDEEHQFFFDSDVSGIAFSYNDEDEDGNPIGLASTLSTGVAGSGTVTIILRHLPNKSGSGVADGDITNAGGETDIEVNFDVSVE